MSHCNNACMHARARGYMHTNSCPPPYLAKMFEDVVEVVGRIRYALHSHMYMHACMMHPCVYYLPMYLAIYLFIYICVYVHAWRSLR